jgi:hypothetical protein
MTISSGQASAIIDNLTKILVDLESNLITNVAGTSPTLATISSGVTANSNSMLARFSALSAGDQLGEMGKKYFSVSQGIINQLTYTKSEIYSLILDYMKALDADIGGLPNFLTANSLLVHPEFAAAFNVAATDGKVVGPGAHVRFAGITPSMVFVAAEQSLAHFAATGATTGTFTADVDVDTTLYAPQKIWIKNLLGGSSTGTATSFTITYKTVTGAVAAAGAPVAISGAQATGAYTDSGLTGVAVTAVAITSGANADSWGFVVKPSRTPAY